MVTPRQAIERVLELRARTRSAELLLRVRETLRAHDTSPGIEEAYAGWIRRYIVFHGMRHPLALGGAEIKEFLAHLAVDCRLSAAMQNQAVAALAFLYRQILEKNVPWLEAAAQPRTPERRRPTLPRAPVRASPSPAR
jgi:hypothetical protein